MTETLASDEPISIDICTDCLTYLANREVWDEYGRDVSLGHVIRMERVEVIPYEDISISLLGLRHGHMTLTHCLIRWSYGGHLLLSLALCMGVRTLTSWLLPYPFTTYPPPHSP